MNRAIGSGLFAVSLILGIACGGTFSSSWAQSTLYDDFSGAVINPAKWVGSEFRNLEVIRSLVGGRLVLAHRVVGQTAATGFQDGDNRLNFLLNPTGITAVRFDILVQKLEILPCSVSGSPAANARAGFITFLFNDGSSTTPNNNTGNVVVLVQLSRSSTSTDAPNVLRAEGILIRCNDAFCGNRTTTVTDLGPVNTGPNVTLRMSWDKANKRVDFQRDAEPTQPIPYTVNDDFPPTFTLTALQVRGLVPNCSTGPHPFSEINASFDNVLVNP